LHTHLVHPGLEVAPGVVHRGLEVAPVAVHQGLEVAPVVVHPGLEVAPVVVHPGLEVALVAAVLVRVGLGKAGASFNLEEVARTGHVEGAGAL
jgi:hypothetical protein